MTKRPPSTFVRIVTAGADRLADRWNVPAESRQAFIQNAVVSFEGILSAGYGGEHVRLWAAKTPPHQRLDRLRRIASSLLAGEDVTVIAQREGVSARHVRRLRRNKAAP